MLMRWNDGSAAARSGDPVWGALTDLRREMDQLFADFDRTWMRPSARPGLAAAMPRMQLSDEGGALQLRMDVPGFAEKDIHIELNRASLTIRGERSTEVPEGYSVHRQERGALAFARTLTLPCRVDADAVEATMRDGVLELRMPKAPEEQPRSIEVRAAS